MKKHATALRAFSHADDNFTDKQVILNMDPGQFADWRDAELVREATDAEVTKARGDKPAAADKVPAAQKAPAKPRKARSAPKAAPAPAPAPAASVAADPAA